MWSAVADILLVLMIISVMFVMYGSLPSIQENGLPQKEQPKEQGAAEL